MSKLIKKLLDAGDVHAVIDAFSEQEKRWYKTFSEEQRKDFEEAVPKLLGITDLPGRIQLTELYYDPMMTMSAWWSLDFTVGLKPGTTRLSVGGLRLRDSYKSVVERIYHTDIEF